MELTRRWRRMLRRLRGQPQPVLVAGDWAIEQHARYLVQKIARAAAARHALQAAERRSVRVRFVGDRAVVEMAPAAASEIDRLRRRIDDADRMRSYALIDLRLALGLPEHPSQAECGVWGEAP